MTERNIKKELIHSCYYDMEYGHDSETIDYDCLIGLLTELCDRIETLEEWKSKAQKSARIVKQTLDAKND